MKPNQLVSYKMLSRAEKPVKPTQAMLGMKRDRKQAVYCRPHGRRIIIFLNGIGGCRKCVDLLVAALQKKSEERGII
jgi:hypothetical protein